MTYAPQSIALNGLDGGNSLAFLAALGTLRTLTGAWPETVVEMSWTQEAGLFRPQLHVDREIGPDTLVEALDQELKQLSDSPALALADNLNVAPSVFREYAQNAVRDAHNTLGHSKRRVWSDFAAAFGCEATVNENAKEVTIQDTALRTMSGAGHQHFLKFMRDLVVATSSDHLRQALFEEWKYDDEGRGLNMRWDPEDDRRYALRWSDPSSDPSRTVRGANRLAIEGLPMLVSVPVEDRLETTGFINRGRAGVFWTWPIWDSPLSMDSVQGLLALSELQKEQIDGSSLASIGISGVFRCQRIRIGKFRNFTFAERL